MTIITLDDLSIKHHFGDNEYIKETKIDAGVELEQHKHNHSHLSVLLSGTAIVTVEGLSTQYTAPQILLVPANKTHKVAAVTDVVWLCVWGTDVKDVSKIDDGLIA